MHFQALQFIDGQYVSNMLHFVLRQNKTVASTSALGDLPPQFASQIVFT